MLRIENGRAAFYQWDVGQRLIVEHDDVVEVAFDNSQTSPALVCTVYQESGIRYVDVPNILLQQPFTLRVYGCCGECVRAANVFKVIPRERPSDYIYTETEVKTLDGLEARIQALELGGSGGEIGVGIEDMYVRDDRLYIERTDGVIFVSGSLRGSPGAPGTDGGFYKPSVAEDGTLTWTASRTGMPPVISTNIKGPPGEGGGASMTDEEAMALMIETDTLPTVHDGGMRVLTDAVGTVILRY